MKIVLVRHGTTGIEPMHQKERDPLSDEGKEQVEHLTQRIQKHSPRIISFYTSNYLRAKQSAEILVQAFTPAIEPTVKEELHEIGLWISPVDLHEEDKHKETLENLRQTQEKMRLFIDSLSHGEDDIHVLVIHGNLIRAIVGTLMKMSVETIVRLSVSNASISVIEYDTDGQFYRLALFNDTAHLQ